MASAFTVHAFFSNARTAGIVGIVFLFSQWILYVSITNGGYPSANRMLLFMLLPNAAFSVGCETLGQVTMLLVLMLLLLLLLVLMLVLLLPKLLLTLPPA